MYEQNRKKQTKNKQTKNKKKKQDNGMLPLS